MNKKYTIIEIVADYIYLALIGKKIDLQRYIQQINNDNLIYIISRIDISISFKLDYLERKYGKIIVDDGIERAQSYIYAQHQLIDIKHKNIKNINKYFNNKYMLLCLEKINDYYILKFPKLELDDEDDPEKIISNWIENSIKSKYCCDIKKSMKPVSLVGLNDEILVYTAKLYY